jgi:hypothetical protein
MECAEAPSFLDSEVSTPPPSAGSYDPTRIPPQALAPLQSFTFVPPRASGLPTIEWSAQSRRPPLPRFFPLQRFSSRAEPHTSNGFPTRWLRCALEVSHPLDALLPVRPIGLISSQIRSWGSPLEAFFLPPRRTLFSNAGPLLRFPFGSEEPNRLSRGTARCGKPTHGNWGLARTTVLVPPRA